jgi:hypothetical protein
MSTWGRSWLNSIYWSLNWNMSVLVTRWEVRMTGCTCVLLIITSNKNVQLLIIWLITLIKLLLFSWILISFRVAYRYLLIVFKTFLKFVGDFIDCLVIVISIIRPCLNSLRVRWSCAKGSLIIVPFIIWLIKIVWIFHLKPFITIDLFYILFHNQ